MSTILSIETSTNTSSVALHKEGTLVSSLNLHVEKSHSEYLTSSIEFLLKTSGIQKNELDAVAISKGPGSYTGLRIGTSTAKGICYALDLKLIAVNTLEAMAHGLLSLQTKKELVCPMIDARRMEVYCLLMEPDGTIIEPTQAKIIDESSFGSFLESRSITFFGNGAKKCKSALLHQSNATFLDDIYPSAEHIGAIATKYFGEQRFEDVAYFEPFYLKDFIAKKPSAKKMVL